MREWIRRFIDRTRDLSGPHLPAFLRGEGFNSGPVVFSATRERFRIVVFRARPEDVCDSCGDPFHWLGLEFRSHGDEWQPLLVVHEGNLPAFDEVVADVANFLAKPGRDREKHRTGS